VLWDVRRYLRVAAAGTDTLWIKSDDGKPNWFWKDLLPEVKIIGPAKIPGAFEELQAILSRNVDGTKTEGCP